MHSRSPLLHNFWLKQHQISGHYMPLPIAPQALGAALRAMPALGFRGCNLTIPHKVLALDIVDYIDPMAKRMGAANCIVVREDGSLAGFNHDGFGFIESLREAKPGWRADAGPIVVLGAGGAARAVVQSLIDRGAREIRLLNRTLTRAQTLAQSLDGPVQVLDWDMRDAALEGAAMLVNTTSQGMTGQLELEISLRRLPAHAIVMDIVYIPLETHLLRAARERGHLTVNGLGMLLHQARPAFQAWFGVMPQVSPQLRTLLEQSIRDHH